MKQCTLLLILSLILFSCKKKKDDTPAPTSTLANGLVAHYQFNGNTNDATSNLNHGTVTGAR